MGPRTDVHQHVWTEPLLRALAQRTALPFAERRDGRYVLHCAGERPSVVDPRGERAERRAATLDADGLDAAIVALSSPIGIEGLPRAQAEPLIAAHLNGVDALGARFGAWGPLALRPCRADDVDALLGRGCAGISLPAGALSGADALDSVGPVLERLEAHGAPVFIHPGPADRGTGCEASGNEPAWWPALTEYVAQMQRAWLTFAARGRRAHPRLTIVFAMLAGGAPLLSERLRLRGGPRVDLRDPRVLYDTSGYGPAAVGAMAERVGLNQLVYGSDRPVVEPLPTPHDALLQRNAGRLRRAPPAG